MRRTNIAIVVIAVLAMIGAGTGIGLAASAGAATRATARTTAVSATHTPTYVVADCSQLQVEPSTYFFACADGNAGLEHMHWTTWSAKLASGYGTYYENDCTPTCVGGHFHTFPALVVLWGSGAVKGHPADRRYTEFTLIFTTSKRPPVVNYKNGKRYYTHPVTQTFPAPAQLT
jgi:hypothetical protein